MVIQRETALKAIADGKAFYSGSTQPENGRSSWIIDNVEWQRTDHVIVYDDEPLVGCMACGFIVEPIADPTGIGCHCPCGASL